MDLITHDTRCADELLCLLTLDSCLVQPRPHTGELVCDVALLRPHRLQHMVLFVHRCVQMPQLFWITCTNRLLPRMCLLHTALQLRMTRTKRRQQLDFQLFAPCVHALCICLQCIAVLREHRDDLVVVLHIRPPAVIVVHRRGSRRLLVHVQLALHTATHILVVQLTPFLHKSRRTREKVLLHRTQSLASVFHMLLELLACVAQRLQHRRRSARHLGMVHGHRRHGRRLGVTRSLSMRARCRHVLVEFQPNHAQKVGQLHVERGIRHHLTVTVGAW